MKATFDFTGVTPKEPQRYATPTPPERAARLVWTGASSFGSHGIRSLLGCLRAAAYARPWARAPHSDQSGRVTMLAEVDGLPVGPFGPEHAQLSWANSVYMIRGTFVHTALAHAFIRGSLRRGEVPVIAGRVFPTSEEGVIGGREDDWYTPAEAVEAGATLTGTPGFRYALPAARTLTPGVVAWAESVLDAERVIAVETQFAYHVAGSPWAYTARYDLLTQNRASKMIYAYDYKTAADPKSAMAKYQQSAQIMGQHQIGKTGYGAQWGGVRIALVPDNGKAETSTRPVVHLMPLHPRGADLAQGIVEAVSRVESIADLDPRAAPANPLFCSGCPGVVRTWCQNS